MKIIKAKEYKQIPKNFTGIVEFETNFSPKYSWLETMYIKDGKNHRLDGPALEFSNGLKQFWINNEYITSDEFIFYNSEIYKLVKKQEDLLIAFKKLKI